MSQIDLDIVLIRLDLITKYLSTLEEFRDVNLNDFLADFRQQLIVERLLQLMIQSAIDINDHILSRLNPGNSATNFEAFIELSRYGIISSELGKQLAPSGSLRNRLVHEYDDIDPEQVYKAIKFALNQYAIYIQQIRDYLISIDT